MAHTLLSNIQRLKAQLPRFFSLGLCATFILAAVIFDRINNFALMYLLTNFLLLAPGLVARNIHHLIRHHGTQLVHKIKTRTAKKQN